MRDFIVLFNDDTTKEHLRSAHMQDHLKFLAVNPEIRAAGPLTLDGAPHGGLWQVRGPDAASVQRLIDEDPFRHTGLRRSWTILGWRIVHSGRSG